MAGYFFRTLISVFFLALLSACGSSGSTGFDPDPRIPDPNNGNNNGQPEPAPEPEPEPGAWVPGVFLPSSEFAQHCADPRPSGEPNLDTGETYNDVQGTVVDENNWLRSWHHETYLWYDQMPDLNPAQYATPQYFQQLRSPALTPTGRPLDNFRWSMGTVEWNQQIQSGVSAGYGARWVMLSSTPPREVRVALVEPGSPADDAGLERGARVLAINGVSMINSNDVNTLNNGLFPSNTGQTFEFTIEDPDGGQRTLEMTSALITAVPVQNVSSVSTPTGNVGYMLFNNHNAVSEQALIDAVEQLLSENITDLVLDLRYNPGGYLYIASQLSFMIAGQSVTSGNVFYRQRFSDKHPLINPVTGQAISSTPFYNGTTTGAPLPTLNLPRVFVLTGTGSCSASEAIINGLRGVDFEVHQIGATTCGKPYGSYAEDNCGTTYSIVQFAGVNDKGFGEYPEGFSPSNQAGAFGVPVPGCFAPDDYTQPLGHPDEARFATALAYRESGSCPSPSLAGHQKAQRGDGYVDPPVWPGSVPASIMTFAEEVSQ